MIYLGNKPIGINIENMKLLSVYTVPEDWTSGSKALVSYIHSQVLDSVVTYGQPNKICVCIFENNNATDTYKMDLMFFSLYSNPSTWSSNNSKLGGMVRNNFSNYREYTTSNSASCTAGTKIYIYEIAAPMGVT